MKHEESKLQIQCVNWFRLAHPKKLIYAIPNGGKRGVITASIMKAEGTVKGLPDLHIPIPNRYYASLYIEMKSPKGKIQQSQEQIATRLWAYGNKVIICRSLDEFMNEVNTYFTT